MAVTKPTPGKDGATGDKGKKSAKNKKDHITDISHTDVPGPSSEEVKIDIKETTVEAEEVTTEQEIKNQIAKFNLADAGIEALKQEYGALTIPDGDKAAYETVKKAWNLVRSKRTGLEKKGLELRTGYTVITKAIKGEEDRLIKALTPLEEDLEKKWRAVDEAKEADKKRKAQEEEEKLSKRLEELMSYGMILKDGFYQLGGTVSMDIVTLRMLPDDQYQKLLGVVKQTAERLEQERIAEEERKAEEQRKLQEEQNKLLEQQNKLREQQEQLDRQQQELQKQQEEAKTMRRDNRNNAMLAAGFIPMQDKSYKFKTSIMIEEDELRVGPEILDIDADLFAEKMTGFKVRIETENKRMETYIQEQEELKQKEEQRAKEIIAQLTELGMDFNEGTKTVIFSLEAGSVSHKLIELVSLDDTERADMITQTTERIAEIKELQRVADEKKEEERVAEEQRKEQERLVEEQRKEEERLADMSDNQILHEMITIVQKQFNDGIKIAKLKTKKGQTSAKKILENVNAEFNRVLNEIEAAKK